MARPFSKFFNIDEHIQLGYKIPDESFRVFEKCDGSLGISYWLGNDFNIASRGSFDSVYSEKARSLANQLYKHVPWNKELTYCFEIIWPFNRIVLDYGGAERLVLLGARAIDGGENVDVTSFAQNYGIDVPQEYYYNSIDEIKQEEWTNKEGFVLLFASGLRAKYKFSWYVQLHKLFTRLSEKDICELLSQEGEIGKLIEGVPDEMFDWVKATEQKLLKQYEKIWSEANYQYWMIRGLPRKNAALHIKDHPYKSFIFQMLDGKSPKEGIWKRIKEGCRPESRFKICTQM